MGVANFILCYLYTRTHAHADNYRFPIGYYIVLIISNEVGLRPQDRTALLLVMAMECLPLLMLVVEALQLSSHSRRTLFLRCRPARPRSLQLIIYGSYIKLKGTTIPLSEVKGYGCNGLARFLLAKYT